MRWKAQYTVKISVISAIICVCSLISVPFTVPLTMQTFAVFFALYYLGGAGGTLAILVYIAIGALGVPVFSGFTGGIGRLFDLTGGYISAFLVAGLVFWIAERLSANRTGRWYILVSALCLPVIYTLGTLQFALISGGGITAALISCVFPFIIPDIIKLTLAYCISQRLKRKA